MCCLKERQGAYSVTQFSRRKRFMGMVVRTNTMGINANRQLNMNNSQVSKSLEKLSSGFRINRAGDDASGLAISEKMKAQIKGLEQASANAQDAISLVQTAEGATTEIHNMLNRMVELATKSANGTYDTSVDRKAIQAEVDSLLAEVDRITDSTNFNGTTLLDGSMTQLVLQIGAEQSDKITVAVTALDAQGLSVKNLKVDSVSNANAAIQTIKTAINKVSTQRADLGAIQNRLEYTVNNLDTTAENMTAANSRIRDTDMAKEMMNYTKMNVLTQAAQAMLAQANQQPQSVLQLLQ
jgi:flagellin